MIHPPECRPKRSTKGSAGYDFIAKEDIRVSRWRWTKVHTGVCLENEHPVVRIVKPFDVVIQCKFDPEKRIERDDIYLRPYQWFMKVYPRSSHGIKYKVRFSTSAIIDQDYRDEIVLELKAEKPFTIKAGDKYAQGILIPYLIFDDEEAPTEDRTGGFGSTGE